MWFGWRRQEMHAEYYEEKLEDQKEEERII
jgi:hypothetical protein